MTKIYKSLLLTEVQLCVGGVFVYGYHGAGGTLWLQFSHYSVHSFHTVHHSWLGRVIKQ